MSDSKALLLVLVLAAAPALHAQQEPLQQRLEERSAEVEKLKQDVARLEGELAAANAAAHEPPYFMTPPDGPARPMWHWALGSFIVALGLGFMLGWQTLDRRIRRKYGGLRVY